LKTDYPHVRFAIARCRIFLPGIEAKPVHPRVLDVLRSARITTLPNQTECSLHPGVMGFIQLEFAVTEVVNAIFYLQIVSNLKIKNISQIWKNY
jgi:hypothetical protein